MKAEKPVLEVHFSLCLLFLLGRFVSSNNTIYPWVGPCQPREFHENQLKTATCIKHYTGCIEKVILQKKKRKLCKVKIEEKITEVFEVPSRLLPIAPLPTSAGSRILFAASEHQ